LKARLRRSFKDRAVRFLLPAIDAAAGEVTAAPVAGTGPFG
jgi:hypothetical protein